MATHTVSILGLIQPDSTGRCWVEPYDVMATNDVWKHPVVRCKDPSGTQAHGFYGQFRVPENYVSTAVVEVIWTSTAVSGNCNWRITYRTVAGDDANSLDQTSNEEQVSAADTAPGATQRRMVASLNVTDANFAAGETVEYLLERADPNGSTDTMAADAVVHDVSFKYADA